MNTEMFNHPIPDIQLKTVQTFNIKIIEPISKKLMCGDIGIGAMAEIETIYDTVQELINKPEAIKNGE